MDDPAPAPTDIEINRERSVTLTWPDHHVSRFALPDLRAACPCAFCRNRRDSGTAVLAPADIRVEAAELVGNWGLQIHWSDGHETGIYPWSLLRRWGASPPPHR